MIHLKAIFKIIGKANDLGAGNLFAQIHTAAYPNGEIYAVLSKKSQSTGDGY